jgi:hypothetical protein
VLFKNPVGKKESGRCTSTGNDDRWGIGIEFLKPFFNMGYLLDATERKM